MTRDRFLERQVEKLQAENKTLKELVDGAMSAIEIFQVGSPAQAVWKAEWLRKAREIFHVNGKMEGK
jgi:hypothetical protein